jgi:hypothetical protein
LSGAGPSSEPGAGGNWRARRRGRPFECRPPLALACLPPRRRTRILTAGVLRLPPLPLLRGLLRA